MGAQSSRMKMLLYVNREWSLSGLKSTAMMQMEKLFWVVSKPVAEWRGGWVVGWVLLVVGLNATTTKAAQLPLDPALDQR